LSQKTASVTIITK